MLRERLRQFGLGVLHPVALVDNHVHPLDLAEQRLLADDVLERRDDDLELARLDPRGRVSTGLGRALEDDGRHCRRPLFKLERPVGDGRQGDDNEERTPLLLLLDQERDERKRLDRLSETLQKPSHAT